MATALDVSLSCTDHTISGQDDELFCSINLVEPQRGTLLDGKL